MEKDLVHIYVLTHTPVIGGCHITGQVNIILMERAYEKSKNINKSITG